MLFCLFIVVCFRNLCVCMIISFLSQLLIMSYFCRPSYSSVSSNALGLFPETLIDDSSFVHLTCPTPPPVLPKIFVSLSYQI